VERWKGQADKISGFVKHETCLIHTRKYFLSEINFIRTVLQESY